MVLIFNPGTTTENRNQKVYGNFLVIKPIYRYPSFMKDHQSVNPILKSQRRTVVPKHKQQNPLKIEKIKSKSVIHINGQSAVDFKKISLLERLLYGW